ncbi:MAG: amidohydrolase family protein [Paenibacillaceae bacterium]|nr:amidohydrolase family protein [Paenibacillaceae bacterium]
MGNRILIKQAYLITMDDRMGDMAKADILIENDKIASVGHEIEAADCEIVNASNMIALPGFVDTHRHVWEAQIRAIAADWTLGTYMNHVIGHFGANYRPEDVYIGNLLGMAEALDAGITTTLDWSHVMLSPDHAFEAIRALRHSGSRAVFAFGTPNFQRLFGIPTAIEDYAAFSRRLKSRYFSTDDQLVTFALAIPGPEFTSVEETTSDITLARELDAYASMHVGISGPHVQPIKLLQGANLLGPDLNFVHGNFLTDEEVKLIAESGGSISITPEVEMQMGMGWPATGAAIRNGARYGLGIDVVAATGGDMFAQMKFALQTERALSNERKLRNGEAPQQLDLGVRDILRAATTGGAQALGLGHKTGSLTPGKDADIILLRAADVNTAPLNNAVGTVVLCSNTANVDTVFVAGKMVKRNGSLLHLNMKKLRVQAVESRDYLYAGKG